MRHGNVVSGGYKLLSTVVCLPFLRDKKRRSLKQIVLLSFGE